MATNYKITYKNHCTPQEYLTENSRWYLDSDIGTRLTGTAVVDLSTTQPTYATDTLTGVQTAVITTAAQDFMYVKNTGATGEGDITISFADADADGSEAAGYSIRISPGECFASKVSTFANLIVKSTATTTYEYIIAT
jgi:hypothetical protein